ncbi:MAG: hypothetical protein ACREQ5_07620 [Candidatus Dormibacteria bacterium]
MYAGHMPYRRDQCKDCGRPATRRRNISARGLCTDCACSRYELSCWEIVKRTGETWDRYLAGMVFWVERMTT